MGCRRVRGEATPAVRLVLRKYDPRVRRHVDFREERSMAKKSKIVKNEQRAVVVARYAEPRGDLGAQIRDAATSHEDRTAAVRALSRLPRDSSAIRLRNRDVADGRPRGYIRKAGLSRIRFRDMAHRGELPGITKSSW